jgi:hypothetical protein
LLLPLDFCLCFVFARKTSSEVVNFEGGVKVRQLFEFDDLSQNFFLEKYE